MLINHWEEFPGGPTRPSGPRVYVSLSVRGVFLLNDLAYEKLGKPEAAVLLYDRRNSMIGIRPAGRSARNAFPFTVKAKTHRAFSATSFCRHYGIRLEQTVAFQDVDVLEDQTLRLDLRTTINIGRPRKVVE